MSGWLPPRRRPRSRPEPVRAGRGSGGGGSIRATWWLVVGALVTLGLFGLGGSVEPGATAGEAPPRIFLPLAPRRAEVLATPEGPSPTRTSTLTATATSVPISADVPAGQGTTLQSSNGDLTVTLPPGFVDQIGRAS